MDLGRLGAIVQLVTGLSVLVGIGLVVYELRQTHEIATADILGQQFAMGVQFDSLVLGEEVAKSLAKACEEQNLSTEDAVVLRNYFWGVHDKFFMIRQANSIAGMEIEWMAFAESLFKNQIFYLREGRIWWERERARITPDVLAIGDRVLNDLGPPSCSEDISAYIAR